MEEAIYISKIEKIKLWEPKYTRLYFGNEFCERLIPSNSELKEVLSFVSDKKIDLSLVTCYVTDKGLDKFVELFEKLSRAGSGFEIIINDWGLLRASRRYPLIPVLGRLLTKQKRDPKVLNIMNKVSKEIKEQLKESSLNSNFIKFLKDKNINRVELDNLLQGISQDRTDIMNFSFSLYLPFGFLSTSRFCFSNLHYRNDKKTIGIFSCKKQCRQKYYYILRNSQTPVPLLIKGNTIFFKNQAIPAMSDESRIDRFVYSPELPF